MRFDEFRLPVDRNRRNQENLNIETTISPMSDTLSEIFRLLGDVVLPNLKAIQVGQAEQRLQTERLNRSLDEFRAEMRVRFTEIRAEIAACRAQVEDAMVTVRESEAAEADTSAFQGKKPVIH
jgi:hypothetical protein